MTIKCKDSMSAIVPYLPELFFFCLIKMCVEVSRYVLFCIVVFYPFCCGNQLAGEMRVKPV